MKWSNLGPMQVILAIVGLAFVAGAIPAGCVLFEDVNECAVDADCRVFEDPQADLYLRCDQRRRCMERAIECRRDEHCSSGECVQGECMSTPGEDGGRDDADADTVGQRPTVELVAPRLGQTLTGDAVELRAEASDDEGIDEVVFRVDQTPIGAVTEPPFELEWSLDEVAAGAHHITAVARDTDGQAARASTEVYVARPSQTAVYYHVAADGDDANPGTSDQPWATLQKAAAEASPGDVVLVGSGRYAGFSSQRSGTDDAPIAFLATADDVVLDTTGPQSSRDVVEVSGHDHLLIDGFTIESAPRAGVAVIDSAGTRVTNNTVGPNGKWGVFTGFAPEVVIADNEIFGAADEHGIYVSNSRSVSDNPVVQRNEVYDNNSIGIHLNGDCHAGGDGVIDGATVEGNRVHHNRLKGMSLASMRGGYVINNFVYDNGLEGGAAGIHLTDEPDCGNPTEEVVVANNTLIEPRMACVRLTDEARDNVFFNNLMIGDRDLIDEVGDNLVDHSSNLNLGSREAVGFVDLDAQDFHLQPDSLAVDAGVAVYEEILAPSADFEGTERPAGEGFDVGADELDR
ncbi:MAG: right-handed parallel beta-helix repeat-containing protein [Persicimonas sp.]